MPQQTNRDDGQIVRKWHIKVSGSSKEQSVELFLTRLEECRALTHLTYDEVLSSLSELLTVVAATWYKNKRHTWRSWQDFIEAITHMYGGDRGHQQRILAEINARTQGRDELTRDYVVNLQAMILKLIPLPSMAQQLDMLHRNMRPELQKMVMRNQITDYRGLLDLAQEAELALAADEVYNSPAPPERTYLPDFAYVP